MILNRELQRQRHLQANVVFVGTVDSGAITSTGQIQGTSITDGTATMTGETYRVLGRLVVEQSRQLEIRAWNS